MLDGRPLLSGLGAEFVATMELLAFDVELLHDTHGHGPPSLFKRTDRNFNAGPNFMFSECIKWSSVSKGNPDPSIHCSRKFWNETHREEKKKRIVEIVIDCTEYLLNKVSIFLLLSHANVKNTQLHFRSEVQWAKKQQQKNARFKMKMLH